MEVPGLIKDGMSSYLRRARIAIDIPNVPIGCSVANKDTREIMFVQFRTAFPSPFDTHTRAKRTKAGKVGSFSIPHFEGGRFRQAMDAPIDKVSSMNDGG